MIWVTQAEGTSLDINHEFINWGRIFILTQIWLYANQLSFKVLLTTLHISLLLFKVEITIIWSKFPLLITMRQTAQKRTIVHQLILNYSGVWLEDGVAGVTLSKCLSKWWRRAGAVSPQYPLCPCKVDHRSREGQTGRDFVASLLLSESLLLTSKYPVKTV